MEELKIIAFVDGFYWAYIGKTRVRRYKIKQ
jgi:hypothetical protein